MINNIYLYIYICFIFCFSFGESLSFSNNLSISYDSNPLKYSENEGVLSSKYLTYSSSLTAKQKIFKRNTRFILSFKSKYYNEISQKSNNSLKFKAKQSLGNYQYLTFSYNYIDNIYLRAYVDYEQGVLDYLYKGTDCYFDYSIITIDYESPIIDKLKRNKVKFNISYIYETQFYNKYFTEFDLELNGIAWKYSSSNRKNKHYISFASIRGENLTANDNTLSTFNMDRGYKEYRAKIYFNHKLKNNNRIGLLINYNYRQFTSSFIDDKLHNKRDHVDGKLTLEYYFTPHKLKNKITFKSRYRKTQSPYQWVEDLKTFKSYILEYSIYFKKIGFK